MPKRSVFCALQIKWSPSMASGQLNLTYEESEINLGGGHLGLQARV